MLISQSLDSHPFALMALPFDYDRSRHARSSPLLQPSATYSRVGAYGGLQKER